MKTVERIVFIGSAGTSINILYQIKDAINNFNYPAEIVGIIDDYIKPGEKISEFSVIGSTKVIQDLLRDTKLRFLFCLYRMDVMKERSDLLHSLNIPQDRFINFIHPLSYISPDIRLGNGNVILSNATIHSGVKLGNNNIINSNVVIEHETTIGDDNFIAACACIGSKVSIGNTCFIGLNSSIRENILIANEVYIGMHSLVIENAIEKSLVYGIPAKPQAKES